jgi:hypothetical protein
MPPFGELFQTDDDPLGGSPTMTCQQPTPSDAVLEPSTFRSDANDVLIELTASRSCERRGEGKFLTVRDCQSS